MSDVKEEAELNTKESGSSSIKFPVLNSTDYIVWAMIMKNSLKVNKIWESTDPGNKIEEKQYSYCSDFPINTRGIDLAGQGS